jgi:hypothetical protein
VSERSRPFALAVVLIAAALGLVGCTDDPAKPKPLPSPTSSSPAASPSQTAPSMPPAAKGTSEASAEAFVRYWIDTLNFSGPHLDSSALRALSKTSCRDCDAIADFIDSVARQGGSITGKGWTFLSTKRLTHGRGGSVTLRASVLVNPQTVKPRAGAEGKKFTGGTRVKTFTVATTGGRWRVSAIDEGIS